MRDDGLQGSWPDILVRHQMLPHRGWNALAHYGIDTFLCIRGSHLTLNLVTEGVELTGQNKLALVGLAFTLEVVIIIAVPT